MTDLGIRIALAEVQGMSGPWKEETKEQRRMACAEELGPRKWLLSKDGYYYLPGSCGYTKSIEQAGRYSQEEAEKRCSSCKELSMEVEPLPDFYNSLNDCKPLIEMANKCGAEVDIIFERDGWCKVRIVKDGIAYIVETKPPESAIVEAFLKWRGRL